MTSSPVLKRRTITIPAVTAAVVTARVGPRQFSAYAAEAIADRLAVVAAERAVMHVSAATLAEAVDGSARDAAVHRVVRSELTCEPVTAAIGHAAGRLRAAAAARRRKPRESTVDALVVATACTLPRPVVILTSDTSDIDLLLAADRTGATHGIRARRV